MPTWREPDVPEVFLVDSGSFQFAYLLDYDGNIVTLSALCPYHTLQMAHDLAKDIDTKLINGALISNCSLASCQFHHCEGSHQ